MPFQIVRNDITKMHVDAIVNTANPEPEYGSGLDSAVYKAAGVKKLLEKRREIGRIEPGTAAVTEGFNLHAKYIIHSVGAFWKDGSHGEEELLRNCYKSVFKLAVDLKVDSIAIPLLASGNYGYPKGIALRVALSEIEKFVNEYDINVYLVVFDDKAFSLSSELYGDIDEYINAHYVEEKEKEEYDFEDAAFEPEPKRKTHGLFRRAQKADSAAMMSLREESVKPDMMFEGAKPMAPQSNSMFMGQALMSNAVSAPAPGKKKSLDDVIKNLDKSFMELVFTYADEKGMTDAEVQKKSNIDRRAFSKLKCGTTKNPSKNTALALAIGLELNLDETKDLLARAGYALSPCSKQDLIVQYFIEREVYNIHSINGALFDHKEALLGNLNDETEAV